MVFNMDKNVMFPDHKTVMLYDLETDSLNHFLGHILEFGYLLLVDDKVVDKGNILVNWGIEISDFTTELTGITEAEIAEKGIEPQEFYIIVSDLFKKSNLTIAHNSLFDTSFMHHFLLSMGDENGIEDYNLDYFDTLTLFVDHVAAGKKPRKPRKNSKNYEEKMVKWEEDVKLVQSHKVDSICRLYGVELIGGHRALTDIIAVYEILKAFKKNNPKVPLDFYINKFGYKKRWKINELSYYPSRISLAAQGTNGERYILDAEEHNLFK